MQQLDAVKSWHDTGIINSQTDVFIAERNILFCFRECIAAIPAIENF
jgi:hypothetical protein